MIVADTNVMSEPTKPAPEPAVLDWFELNSPHIVTTAVSVGEIFRGLGKLPKGRRAQRMRDGAERVLGLYVNDVLPYDDGAARIYAEMATARRRSGRPLATEDGMIAAICVRSGAALATRNASDFDGLGLMLIDPWSAS